MSLFVKSEYSDINCEVLSFTIKIKILVCLSGDIPEKYKIRNMNEKTGRPIWKGVEDKESLKKIVSAPQFLCSIPCSVDVTERNYMKIFDIIFEKLHLNDDGNWKYNV
jgi:hypothetical protein